VPRAGGAAESIQAVSIFTKPCLTVGPDYAAWANDTTVYSVADTPNAQPVMLAQTNGVFALFSDQSLVYLLDEHGITTVPATGGARTVFRKFDNTAGLYVYPVVSGDSIYAVETPVVSTGPYYLVSMPKSGGGWKRLTLLPRFSGRMSLSGQAFVVAAPHVVPDLIGRRFFQGNVSDGQPSWMELEAPPDPDRRWANEFHAWDVSQAGLFFAEAGKIYSAPVYE
jgi:hypothetical protein